MSLYEDGSSFCFSCNVSFKKEDAKVEEFQVLPLSSKLSIEEIREYPIRGIQERNITKKIAEFFGVRVSYDSDGGIDSHFYPYGITEVTGYKERKLPKEFRVHGKQEGLFGQRNFPGGGKKLVITEGECDAMAVAQAFLSKTGKIYPVVSLPSANADKHVLAQRDWLRGFDEVVLLLDSDEPGKIATQRVAKIIGADKVSIGSCLPHKDPCDLFLKDGAEALDKVIWRAVKWRPEGIVGKEELWKLLEEYNEIESIPYPPCLDGLNQKLKGMRFGEIALFTSGTGSGKSSIMREIMTHIIDTTKDKLGIVSLEESPAETARKLSGMMINKNPSYCEIPISELRVGFHMMFGEDRVQVLDHQGSMSGGIIDKLEYMALSGCKYLFIDHITILVSEGADGKEGNEAIDKIMNDLLRVAKRHNVWIGLVSHLRKTGNSSKPFEEGHLPSMDDIRGSGSIKQISFDIVAFARNMISEKDEERNTIRMRVLKSRYTGLTGDGGNAHYDNVTGRLSSNTLGFQIINTLPSGKPKDIGTTV